MNINYNNRVFGLDVFRAIAILLVVLEHGKLVAGNLFENLPSIPLIDGVDLFFVLSGFLIGSILIKTIEKEGKITFSSLANFWKRRWFRTLPNYYLILLINYLLVKNHFTVRNIENYNYKFLFFLQNLNTGFIDFFLESWSLSVEEWFYILLPVFLFVFLLFFSKKTTLVLAIALLIIAPLIYRISISDMQVNTFSWDMNFRKVVFTRLDSIIYGVLAAYLKFYHSNFWYNSRNKMFILGLMIIFLNIYMTREPNDFYTKTFSFSITSIGAMLLLSKADSVKSFKNSAIGKSITYISLLSYSMYLVNLGLVAQVIEKNVELETKWENVSMYAVYWVATFLISALIYKYYEKPIMDLRNKFSN